MQIQTASKRKSAGFTLIEILVAITLFTFVVAIVAGLFIYAVRIQRQVLAQQELLGQVSYVAEYMSRALRMAKKELNDPPTCLINESGTTPAGSGFNYQLTHFDGSAYRGIRFIDTEQKCQEFFLEGTTLKEYRAGVENIITGQSLEVLNFRPVIAGESQEDTLQPRVTFLLEVRRKGGGPTIRIQTTISQRDLDI